MSAMIFKLAPMSTGLRVGTWVLFVLPLLFLAAGLIVPAPVSYVLLPATAFIVLLYGLTWLVFRPGRFELDDRTLRIVWPMRQREIARADIVSARLVTSTDFRAEYGLGMRIGVGGLWGAFGLLQTDRETFSLWISRTDRYVVVMLRNGRPLLITPERPERFVEAVTAHRSPGA